MVLLETLVGNRTARCFSCSFKKTSVSAVKITNERFQEPVDGEDECQEDERIFVYPRELVGGLQLLTSEPSFFTLRSHTAASYAVICKKDFFESVFTLWSC